MGKDKGPSILNRFSLAYLIQIFIAFTVAGFIFMGIAYTKKKETFYRSINKNAHTFADVIAYPLWSYDFDAIGRYAQLYLDKKTVCAVSVYDESGKTVVSKTSPCLKKIRFSSLEERIYLPVKFNGQQVGKIELVYSKQSLKEFVDNFVFLMLCLIIILSIFLMVGSRYLINAYILQPVNILSNAIADIRDGKYGFKIIEADVKFREFKTLVNEIKNMIDAIRQREEDLKEVNEELRIILSSIPDGYVLMDLSGRILQINESMAKMFNYSEDKLLGMRAMDLSDETFTERLLKQYFEQAMNKGFASFNWLARTNDGRSFWILVRLKQIVLKRQKYMLALVLDIDEQIRLQKRLKESEEKFRTFAENTRAALFLYSEYFEYVNPATCRILGYSEEELLRMHFWDVIHPEERNLVKQRGLKRIEGEEVPSSYEFRVVRKDGKVRWVEFVADRVEINNKNLALGTAIDITARKVYQEGLKEEKEKLAATLKSIAEGVIVLDEKGKVKIVNKAAERLLNKKESEIIGSNCSDILVFFREDELSGKEVKRVSVNFKDAIDRFQNDNLFLFREDGDKIYVSVSASPVKTDGKVIGAVIVISDITEHEIFKREIVKQKKLESLATLAAGIAHDFNNMLQILQGNIELASIKAPEDLKPILERAQKSLQNATKLAHRLLTFAKGGAPIKQKIVNLKEYLKGMVDLFLAGSSIKVIIDVEDNLFPIEADPTQLEQVFQNIFTNAKDILRNKGTIKIKAENFYYDKKKYPGLPLREKYAKYVHITISDNGPGIPPDVLDRIFEPYFTTKKYGTGLGLAVAYSVISKHEGYITAENKPEGGAVFHIYLPVKEGVEEEEKPVITRIETKKEIETPKKEKTGSGDIDFSKLRILFMDDEEDVREVAEDFALALNCKLVSVENGEEAIKVYKESMEKGEKFDLVFVDLTVVGGMGGEETLKELKKIDPNVKVVVSSGYAHSAAMSQFKKIGFVNVLPKPYLLDDFKRIIIESLSD